MMAGLRLVQRSEEGHSLTTTGVGPKKVVGYAYADCGKLAIQVAVRMDWTGKRRSYSGFLAG